MKIWLVEGYYNAEGECGPRGYGRVGGPLGVYSSKESADKAAEWFIALAQFDDEYCARGTCITDHDVNSGWFETFWNTGEEEHGSSTS